MGGIITNNIPAIITNTNLAKQQDTMGKRTAHNSKGQTLNDGSDISGKSFAKDVQASEHMAKTGRAAEDSYRQKIKETDKADNKYATIYNRKGRVAEKEDERRQSYEKMDNPYRAVSRMAFLIIGEQLEHIEKEHIEKEDEHWGSLATANLIIQEINHISQKKPLVILETKIAFQKGFDLAITRVKNQPPAIILDTYWLVMGGLTSLEENHETEEN